MIEGRTVIAKPFLAGTTRRVQFQIIDKETGQGFQPTTLLLSIFDIELTSTLTYLITGEVDGLAVQSVIVNSQDDEDITAFCDTDGNVDLYLTPEDTDLDVPDTVKATPWHRTLAFRWTWDSPEKTAKHEIVLSIAPDRETVAT